MTVFDSIANAFKSVGSFAKKTASKIPGINMIPGVASSSSSSSSKDSEKADSIVNDIELSWEKLTDEQKELFQDTLLGMGIMLVIILILDII